MDGAKVGVSNSSGQHGWMSVAVLVQDLCTPMVSSSVHALHEVHAGPWGWAWGTRCPQAGASAACGTGVWGTGYPVLHEVHVAPGPVHTVRTVHEPGARAWGGMSDTSVHKKEKDGLNSDSSMVLWKIGF